LALLSLNRNVLLLFSNAVIPKKIPHFLFLMVMLSAAKNLLIDEKDFSLRPE
jgi:hypothetical protein